MHVHEHIWTALANQQVVVKQRPTWLSWVGVQQLSSDAHEQGQPGDDVQPVAPTTSQLAVRMQARPLVTGSNQAS